MGFFSNAVKAAGAGAVGYYVGGPTGAAAGAGMVLQSDGIDKARDSSVKGQKRQFDTLERAYQDSAPARLRLQELSASDPTELTGYQETALDDTVRDVRAGLAAAGVRGSPRNVAAGFDAIGRTRDRMIESNRVAKDQAANRLATLGYGMVLPMGRTQANIGNTRAAADSAQGNLLASTAGTVLGAALAQNKNDRLANLGAG